MTDYAANDRVPTEIVQLATCEVAGDWRFGKPVHVWKDGVTWHIRGSADDTVSAWNIDGRNGVNRPAADALIVVTGDPQGCSINGRLIDVRVE